MTATEQELAFTRPADIVEDEAILALATRRGIELKDDELCALRGLINCRRVVSDADESRLSEEQIAELVSPYAPIDGYDKELRFTILSVPQLSGLYRGIDPRLVALHEVRVFFVPDES